MQESAGRLHRLSGAQALTICPRAEGQMAAILTQKGKPLNVSFSRPAEGRRDESQTPVSSLTIGSESPSIAGLTRKRWPRGADLGRAASATHSGKTSLVSGEAA